MISAMISTPSTIPTAMKILFALSLFLEKAEVGGIVDGHFAFHIKSKTWQMGLSLLCTIPFWTSNVIRMISWIPLLGRNGLVNQALVDTGLAKQPVEWLLFSDFAVIVASNFSPNSASSSLARSLTAQ